MHMEAYILLILISFNFYHNLKFGNGSSKLLAGILLITLVIRLFNFEFIYTPSFLIFSFSQLLLFFILPFKQWNGLKKLSAITLLPLFSLASVFKMMHLMGSYVLLILLIPAVLINLAWMIKDKPWKDPYFGFSLIYSFYAAILAVPMFV
jgi:RsiW-degrading membrane proteinase PrsW (M82 family)